MLDINSLFIKSELIPAIIQEKDTNEVLMLAYMNKESLKRTLETGYTWFWSRSRQEYWINIIKKAGMRSSMTCITGLFYNN